MPPPAIMDRVALVMTCYVSKPHVSIALRRDNHEGLLAVLWAKYMQGFRCTEAPLSPVLRRNQYLALCLTILPRFL